MTYTSLGFIFDREHVLRKRSKDRLNWNLIVVVVVVIVIVVVVVVVI